MAETVLEGLQEGDSIAVDGVCLTAVAFNDEDFVVQISPETYERTALGRLKAGDAVNLERAMAANARFGGHMVQGHVDGVGRIVSSENQGEFAVWKFKAPPEVAKYLIPKGSVTIDGISLTVVEPKGDTFSVALIPATLEKTTLSMKSPGDPVNMEADMVGKHIYHYLKGAASAGVSLDKLKRHGFA